MLAFLDPLRDFSFLSVMTRVLLTCVCGALIGLERSSKNRPAGFRTHILVCLGACIAALTALYLYMGLKLPTDISRISGQVVTGLGFIGAGTIIITKKMTIKGLTTAAGLWATGIVGLAIGNGYYELGLLGTALILLAETWLARLGGTIQKSPTFIMEVLYNEKDALDNVLRFCKDKGMAIVNLHIKSLEDHPEAKYAAEVTLRGTEDSQTLVNRVQLMQGITAADVI